MNDEAVTVKGASEVQMKREADLLHGCYEKSIAGRDFVLAKKIKGSAAMATGKGKWRSTGRCAGSSAH